MTERRGPRAGEGGEERIALERTIAALGRARAAVDGADRGVKPTPVVTPARERGGNRRAAAVAAALAAAGAAALLFVVAAYRTQLREMRREVAEMSSGLRRLEAERIAEREEYERRLELMKARIAGIESGAAEAHRRNSEKEDVRRRARKRWLGLF